MPRSLSFLQTAQPPRRRETGNISCGLAVLTVCCALSGCNNAATDRKTLQNGFAKYDARQIDEAQTIADKYIAADPPGPNLDEAYYLRGLVRLTQGNRAGAVTDLRDAIKRTARPDLKGKAYREIGDVEYDQSRWPEAQKDYELSLAQGAATLTPANITYLNFRIGACLQALGDWTRAQTWFAKVVAAKNDSTLTDKAMSRMHLAGFSLQFGAFQKPDNARDQVNQLKSAGVDATITSELSEGQLWYFVRSGSYRTLSDATTARELMLSKYPQVVIMP